MVKSCLKDIIMKWTKEITYLAHSPAFFDFSTSNESHSRLDWQDLHQAAIPKIHPTVSGQAKEMMDVLKDWSVNQAKKIINTSRFYYLCAYMIYININFE